MTKLKALVRFLNPRCDFIRVLHSVYILSGVGICWALELDGRAIHWKFWLLWIVRYVSGEHWWNEVLSMFLGCLSLQSFPLFERMVWRFEWRQMAIIWCLQISNWPKKIKLYGAYTLRALYNCSMFVPDLSDIGLVFKGRFESFWVWRKLIKVAPFSCPKPILAGPTLPGISKCGVWSILP